MAKFSMYLVLTNIQYSLVKISKSGYQKVVFIAALQTIIATYLILEYSPSAWITGIWSSVSFKDFI